MSKHIISAEELVGTIRHELAGSHGRASNKSLYFIAQFDAHGMSNIEYEVRHNGQSMFNSAMLDVAIERYNELP